jgi:hypothetical protein
MRAVFDMAAYTFRCPSTRSIVEGWIADGPTDDKADTYECVICRACMCAHWVNPKTRKVLGADRKPV